MGDQSPAERYLGFFQSEYERIKKVENRVHRKILVVTLLSALAKGRFPDAKSDKERFVCLIEEHAGWPDAISVSVPQLAMRIQDMRNRLGVQSQTLQDSGFTPDFIDGLDKRVTAWVERRNRREISRASIDPEAKDLLPPNASIVERRLAEDCKHSNLLYQYRSSLVHEFREPGHGFEFSNDGSSPFYHTVSDMGLQNETTELVYPTNWFMNLPALILVSLATYFAEHSIDPYKSYKFGSPWRQ